MIVIHLLRELGAASLALKVLHNSNILPDVTLVHIFCIDISRFIEALSGVLRYFYLASSLLAWKVHAHHHLLIR
jgi:hypothetical protein